MEEKNYEYFHIRIGDGALSSLLLAALEAFELGDGKKTVRRVETYGYLWGNRRDKDDGLVINVDRVSVSISAKRTEGSVAPNLKATEIKRRLIEATNPELLMLGDFHSHPYASLAEVKSAGGERGSRGYHFSDGDHRFFQENNQLREAAQGLSVHLVVTICPISKVRESDFSQIKTHICQFSIGEFRFWITAGVSKEFKDDNEEIIPFFTGNAADEIVFLDINDKFYNPKSARIKD
jgi:hypothetical protein